MEASREEMIRFIKEKHPDWTGLRVKGITGRTVSFDSVPDNNIRGVYYSLIRRIKTGNKAKAIQMELPL
jgi:hypothetical protein